MLCPYCFHKDTKVIDKRDSEGIAKRRRECLKCEKRFNTKESVDKIGLKVAKKNDLREEFDQEKLRLGVIKACEKRPISSEQIDKMLNKIEERLRKKGDEVASSFIGELTSKELKKIDKIAYIRFASVYRDFTDISDFKKEIMGLIKK